MKFFDPGEPSFTLSQCWSIPRAPVSVAMDSARFFPETDPTPLPSATVRISASETCGGGEGDGNEAVKP